MALPSTVTGISVTSTYEGLSIMLSWDTSGIIGASDGISGYNVYRSPIVFNSPTDYFTQLNSSLWIGLTYYDKPPIGPDGTGSYWYKVSAENGEGEGAIGEPHTSLPYDAFDNAPIFSSEIEDLIVRDE